jgi:hypothetical protein
VYCRDMFVYCAITNRFTIKKAKIWYSVDSNCHRRCLIQHKSRNIGGLFKVNCGAMDGDLRRLKKILEAKWLIYVILRGIGKVSNRFYKFSFLMLIGWGRYEWKKIWRQNVASIYRYLMRVTLSNFQCFTKPITAFMDD